MNLLWFRKQSRKETIVHDKIASVEVEEIKHKAHESAEKADHDINKLNDLLRANGITLKIFVATGGDKRVH